MSSVGTEEIQRFTPASPRSLRTSESTLVSRRYLTTLQFDVPRKLFRTFQIQDTQVDTEDFVPDVLLGLCDRPVALDPGAVDEHVYPSIGLHGEVDEAFHVSRGGHVSLIPLTSRPSSRSPPVA